MPQRCSITYHQEWDQLRELAKSEGKSISAKIYELINRELETTKKEARMAPMSVKVQSNISTTHKRTKFGRNPEFLTDAKRVAEVIRQTKRINLREGTIAQGSKLLNQLTKKFPEDEDPHERISNILDWYSRHYQDEYVPQFCSFNEFVTKFFSLEDAMDRGKKKNGHTNGHTNGHSHSTGDMSRKSVKALFWMHNPKAVHYYMETFNGAKQVLRIKADNRSPECLELAQNIIELIAHVSRTRTEHIGSPIEWMSVVGGGSFDLINEYNRWFDQPEAAWVKNKRLSMYRPDSGVFREYCHWYGTDVLSNRDPLTGEYVD